MTQFCRFELRTTDVPGARDFYRAVIGDLRTDIVALPAEAAARGARPHWLGHLGVDDVERVADALTVRGATRLGPTRPAADGRVVAILRDPGGAVVALTTPPESPAPPEYTGVLWHTLNTADLSRTTACYCALFGWQLTQAQDLGPLGVYHHFAWRTGGPSVGAIADLAGRPGVHPHWLFHFRVAALEPALAAVGSAGGLVLPPVVLPDGERIAVCDDPQGAAFALHERPPALPARPASSS